ncbi:hypothetical protein GSI_04376 [Ganoderma sinense ZZ0214-1]|uniref:Uncharacterized protein n=1 Tax=Ganoderma sinense ZZ0214-1 TaxID=1077348 RepID=A0A2G8SJ18_9APHY|nr:hypothetical protein GSI_04376 [Ganoderma sinense ZZ0214-1]
MPRRLPTPPPPDDSLFFTVVNPYPEQPYQSSQGRKVFARWIASIVGRQRLYAFYHRPKSPSMVIIEVSKDDFSNLDLRRLLGAHRWGAILKTPNNECWQKVDIEAFWLHKWSPEEDRSVHTYSLRVQSSSLSVLTSTESYRSDIVYPYPLPGFCQPPPEDIMRNPLCRPLRESLFSSSTEIICAAQQSARIPVPYRSLPVFDPSDDDFDFDNDSSSSDGLLPTPFGVTPPGLAPLPSTVSPTRFVPAIHGADTPKSGSVKIVLHSGSDADTEGEALWAGYGETDAPPPPDQCRVHGYMCSSGICRQQALRKRDALNEERERKRRQERNEWNMKREARQERRDWAARRRGSGSGGSGGEASRVRDDIPSWTTRGRDGRRAPASRSAAPGPPTQEHDKGDRGTVGLVYQRTRRTGGGLAIPTFGQIREWRNSPSPR